MLESLWAVLAGLPISALRSSTPLILAVLAEILTQRTGVVNLGIEGQMLLGAMCGFGTTLATGNPWLGLMAGSGAGMMLSCVHALLCVKFKANQIASGIATFILGSGLSAYYGVAHVGKRIEGFGPIPVLSHLPFFNQFTPTICLAIVLPLLAGLWLFRTRTGLRWRAVGEAPQAAAAMGVRVWAVQTQGILLGGVLSGLAGSALSVDYTRNWVEDMTAGRGLVAVGLVILARWNPFLAIPAAMLFGGTEALSLGLQATGLSVSAYLLSTLPYLVPLVVLVLNYRKRETQGGMPAGLKAVFSGMS
jgi:simple sugar transport system permease protein